MLYHAAECRMIATGLAHQLRQLRHDGRDPSRLILGKQFGCRRRPVSFLVVDISQLLPAAVLRDEGGTNQPSVCLRRFRFSEFGTIRRDAINGNP